MITLFGRDEYSVLGIAAVLDVEKIPYRRISKIGQPSGDLLLVADSALSPVEVASLERQPCVVLNGGTLFARQAFGAASPSVTSKPCSIVLDAPIWPFATAELARGFGKTELRIPLAPLCETAHVARGTSMAAFGGTRNVAVLQMNRLVWSAADLGAAFANLLTENYLPRQRHHGSSSSLRQWTRRSAEGAYYAAPSMVRRWVQARSYARLERRLEHNAGTASEYPIDATGWLLIELVKALIKLATGVLIRLEKWPAPHRAAATLTHDVEPQRYAYTTGLERLIDRGTALGHRMTVGLVARATERYLPDSLARRLSDMDIMCHGLKHRGENVVGRAQVAMALLTARTRLERRLGRPVTAYRSPRLDRSTDLIWALDCNEFRCDSSYPDVDRENIRHFGGGVRLNFPYRPLLDDEPDALRPSRCLELPLTAPDCIQPLFAGQTPAALRASVEQKAAFLRQTGGLYVALVHAGVFGDRDAAVREEHMAFVHDQLQHPDTWLASVNEIVDWWRGREALQLTLLDGAVHIRNEGERRIAGVRLVVEQEMSETVLPVRPLDPGAQITLVVPHAAALAAMEPLVLRPPPWQKAERRASVRVP